MDSIGTKAKIQELIETFVRLSEDAAAHSLAEYQATIKIQCAWRRKLVQVKLGRWNRAAIDIQRLYRGHLGRVKFMYKQVEVGKEIRMAFFNRKANLIQRMYRGYRSRKYVHSYYHRKEFISLSVGAGEEVKRDVEDYNLELRHQEQEKTADVVKGHIRNFWLTNHHLIGTKSRNGVFYSAYIAVLKGINDIEDRIIETGKEDEREQSRGKRLRRRKRPGRKHWAVDMSQFVTTQGVHGPSPYERRRAEEKAAALLDVGYERFRSVVKRSWNVWDTTGGKTIRLETEWRRKEKLRSLEQRKSQLLFMRVAPKPFFISPPKNRRFSCGPVPPLGS